MINVDLLNGSNLAFIGDAYYELYIRKYLLSKGITNQKELHQQCVKFVSARGHHLIVQEILENLSPIELNIYKRGRNSKTNSRRVNFKRSEYLESSGFEALIGYLYLQEDHGRLDEILQKSIKIIEELNQ